MARPIRIPIVSDVTGFLRGTKDVEGALDDVASSLDDVGREARDAGDDAGRALSEGIEDGARDAERALDDLGRTEGPDRLERTFRESFDKVARDADDSAGKVKKSYRDAFDDASKASSDAGRNVGDNVDDGFRRAKEGTDEFKQSASESAEEVASSFDGSADSIADGFQEVSSEAFAGFGPAAAIAGLAAAAGIGVIRGAMERGKEKAQELRDRISELAGAFDEVRSGGTTALDHVADRMRELRDETEDGKDNIRDLVDQVARLEGISIPDVVQGIAGDPQALEDAIGQLRNFITVTGEVNTGEDAYRTQQRRRAQELLDDLETEQQAQQEARETDAALRAAGIEDLDAEIAKRQEKKDAAIQYLEEEKAAAAQFRDDYAGSIQEAYDEAGSAIEEFVEDGKFNLDEYNKHLEESADAIRNYQTNVVAASAYLSEQALDYVRSLGPSAAPALQAFIDAPNDQKARTAANWHEQGVVASGAYRQSLAAGIPDSIPGPTVRIGNIDDSSWVAWANAVSRRGITVPIRVQTFANQAV